MITVAPVLASWKKNRHGHSWIMIRFTDGRKPRYRSTGIRVTEKQWDKAKGEVVGTRLASVYNAKIREYLSQIEYKRDRMAFDGAEPTVADLMSAMDDEDAPAPVEKPATILEEFDRFLEGKKARCRPSTIQVYDALRSHLKDWLPKGATVEKIGRGFLEDFQTHLVKKKLANSTSNKLLTRARGFLAHLEDREKIDRAPKARRLPEPKNMPLYLTVEELNALMNLDLTGYQPGYAAARDLFVVEALTGQRYSDLMAMRWEDVTDGADAPVNPWWRLSVQKKAVTLRVPLAAPVRAIIESRRGESTPLPVLSNQKCNDFLKIIGELAGITEPVSIQTLSGALRERETFRKCDLLTSHCARRTFVSLALQNDTPVTALLGLTHDDLRTLRLYAGADDRERAKHVERLADVVTGGAANG